jgi:hypothetical protein
MKQVITYRQPQTAPMGGYPTADADYGCETGMFKYKSL